MNEMKLSNKEFLKPEAFEGKETLELLVRNNDKGEGVLFTRDGKLVGHQIAHMGFYYYMGHDPDRVKMFRATFRVDSMKSDVP